MATHYPCGHPRSKSNTRYKENGSRELKPACRKCFNKYQREFMRQNRKAGK